MPSNKQTDQPPLEDLRKAVDEDPSSAKARIRLGTALQRAGRISEAEAELRQAIEINPKSVKAWVNLGGVLFSKWDFEGAIDANKRATELNPEAIEAYFNRGLGHLYRGEADEMLACYKKVIELDPNHAAGLYHLAVAYNALGNTAEAQKYIAESSARGYSPQPELLKAIDKALTQKANNGTTATTDPTKAD